MSMLVIRQWMLRCGYSKVYQIILCGMWKWLGELLLQRSLQFFSSLCPNTETNKLISPPLESFLVAFFSPCSLISIILYFFMPFWNLCVSRHLPMPPMAGVSVSYNTASVFTFLLKQEETPPLLSELWALLRVECCLCLLLHLTSNCIFSG